MNEGKRIAVVGATGRVGVPLVEVLERRGNDVVAASRATGVDVTTGEGLAEALEGVEVIVDVASGPSPDEAEATEFFTASARNLQAYGERAGVGHLVVVSIIGVDRFSSGYNAAKLKQERIAQAGPIPASVLRAAQFHEFVAELVNWSRQGDVAYMAEMVTQLVAARTVAEALAELAEGPVPDGRPVTEICGPRPERLAGVARLLVASRGEDLRIEERSDPADPNAELYAAGALLPGPDATLAGPTYEAWLEETREGSEVALGDEAAL